MLAVVNTPGGPEPVAIREVAEPQPRPNEALVAVHAFSLNRGEMRLFQVRPEGWRPGQDIAGVVRRAGRRRQRPGRPAPASSALCDWEGWAERAAVPSHRMAPLADNVVVRRRGLIAGRRADGVAHPAPRRAAARQASADHRRGRRGRQPRGAARGAFRRAGHCGRRQCRARPRARRARRRRNRHRHRGCRGPLRADPRSRRRRLADGRDRAGRVSAARSSSSAIRRASRRQINFRDFAEHQNARIQGFHYFTSEAEESFGPDLALLVSLVADGSLMPRIAEHSWRELARIGPKLRDRQIPGKAVFRIEQN